MQHEGRGKAAKVDENASQWTKICRSTVYLDLTCWDKMVAGILGLGLSKMGHGQGGPKQHRPEPEWQQKLSCWHFCSVDVFETFLLD